MLYPSKQSGPPPKEPRQPRIHTYDTKTRARRLGRIFTIINILLLLVAVGVYLSQQDRQKSNAPPDAGRKNCLAQLQKNDGAFSLSCQVRENEIIIELAVKNRAPQPLVPFAKGPAELKIISRLDGQALFYQQIHLDKQAIPTGGILGRTFRFGVHNWSEQSVLLGSFQENVANLIVELVIPAENGAKLLRLEVAKFLKTSH